MTRFYLDKVGKKIVNITLQDETGVYEALKNGKTFRIHQFIRAREVPIFLEKDRSKVKTVSTTTQEYLEYHRLYERNLFDESIPDKIQESDKSKEEIVENYEKEQRR